jgi:sn-glycerol 3-phosphate transport system substrate-binding protein
MLPAMTRTRVLVALMALSLVASCKSDTASTPSPAGTEASGPVEVKFWYAYGGQNRKVTEALIERFNSAHPDIVVKGTYQGDYFESLAKLRVASRTSSGPVVTHVIGEALPQLWQSKLLEDLTPYAKGDTGAALNQDDFIPALTQDGYFDYGDQKVPLFALPFNRSTPICYYNERMFKEAGLEPPKTWEELRSHAKKLTVREGEETKVWGFELPVDWWFWYGMLHQAGGTLLDPSQKKAAFGGAEGQAALTLLIDMVKVDKTMRHPPGRDYNAWEVANTDFLNEKVAMIWTSTAFLAYFEENAKFEFGTAFLPGKTRKAVPTGGTFFVMMAKAPDAQKKAGWKFLRWMSEPAQTAYWARNTGYMPVRKSALESDELKKFYKDNPDYSTAIEQLDHAVKFPFSPHLLEIQRKILQPNLEGPVVGRGTVQEVLTKASADADRVLAR